MNNLILNDLSYLGYLLSILLGACIIVLLTVRWMRYGLCMEKRALLLLVVVMTYGAATRATMRRLLLIQDPIHIEALKSWWWEMGAWAGTAGLLVVALYIYNKVWREHKKLKLAWDGAERRQNFVCPNAK